MKKIKLPLEMANGVLVRTLDELKENWDLEKVLNYYLNGKLQTWLTDRYYTELSDEVAALNGITDNTELQQKLCGIFGIEIKENLVDVEAVAERNRRLEILRQYTADDAVFKNVDKVAFNQEELAELLDEGESVIYLCNNKFSIPLSLHNKKYIGIGRAEIQINSEELVDFNKIGIQLINVYFNEEYEKIMNSNATLYKKAEELELDEKYNEALMAYKKAAQLGDDKSLYKLADFYRFGKPGIQKNMNIAIGYYKQILALGDNDIINNIAEIYQNEDYIDEAIEWYKKSADFGNIEAMNALGALYFDEEDYDESLKWYKNSAALGSVKAINEISNIYFEMMDNEKGFKWLDKAIKLNDGTAMNTMGNICYDEENYEEAFDWYLKAANLKVPEAMNSIADMYFHGIGIKQNDEECVKWLKEAVKYKNSDSAWKLGLFYKAGNIVVEKNCEKAFELFEFSAKDNNPIGMRFLADMYLEGNSVNKNVEKAMEWYKKSADLNDSKSMYSIGNMYYYGIGIGKDYNVAMKWYKRAANLNLGIAINKIGEMYENGEGVPQDDFEAQQWYSRGVNLNILQSVRNLGLILLKMDNGVNDDIRAYNLLSSAAKAGDARAVFGLALMYATGRCVSKDVEYSKQLIKQAADMGDLEAKKVYAEINQS